MSKRIQIINRRSKNTIADKRLRIRNIYIFQKFLVSHSVALILNYHDTLRINLIKRIKLN